MPVPGAPRLYVAGVIPSCACAFSYTRLVEPYPASYSAGLTRPRDRSSVLNRSRRRASRYWRGLMPSTRWKVRSSRWDVTPACALRAARLAGRSGRASISRHTVRTSGTPGSGAAASPGRQRRQGRKPASSAASGTGKNATCPRRGRRLGHEGRQ